MGMGLSKSALEIFKDCPRCFWLEKNKNLKRPAGIKASIMNGLDQGMKDAAEYAIATGKPISYLKGIVGAAPFKDRGLVKKFSNWRTFQANIVAGNYHALIWGQVDDLIEWRDGRVSPWDFKSNGKKREWVEYTMQYNTLQADMYEILLEAQGLETTGKAYFSYTWPIVIDGVLTWDHETVSIDTDKTRALIVIEAALNCLSHTIPMESPTCNYCTFVHQRGLVW